MEHLLELVRKRRQPGILIFDCNGKLLYSNKEVLLLLPNLLEVDDEGVVHTKIPEEIRRLCALLQNPPKADDDELLRSGAESDYAFMIDGREQYFSLRAFAIGGYDRLVSEGHVMVLLERVVEKHSFDFEKIKNKFTLSNRELQVVQHLCQGLSNRGIAKKLFISEYTVKDHIKKIMEKMQVGSRGEILAALR